MPESVCYQCVRKALRNQPQPIADASAPRTGGCQVSLRDMAASFVYGTFLWSTIIHTEAV